MQLLIRWPDSRHRKHRRKRTAMVFLDAASYVLQNLVACGKVQIRQEWLGFGAFGVTMCTRVDEPWDGVPFHSLASSICFSFFLTRSMSSRLVLLTVSDVRDSRHSIIIDFNFSVCLSSSIPDNMAIFLVIFSRIRIGSSKCSLIRCFAVAKSTAVGFRLVINSRALSPIKFRNMISLSEFF